MTTTSIVDELFEQMANVFDISFTHDKEKYLTYLFNIADAFVKKGIHGTKIDEALSPETPRRAVIRRKIREIAPLFTLVIDSANTLCENNIFSYLPEDKRPISQEMIVKITQAFQITLCDYWSFLCVGFLGHIFNQEAHLRAEVNKFHNKWLNVIQRIALSTWESKKSADYIASTSMTYIFGMLSEIQKHGRDDKQIMHLCQQLKKYWLRESITALEVDYSKQSDELGVQE